MKKIIMMLIIGLLTSSGCASKPSTTTYRGHYRKYPPTFCDHTSEGPCKK